MTSKIQEAAEKYTDSDYFRLEYSTFGKTANECNLAFKAGANFMLEESSAKIAKLTEALENLLSSTDKYSENTLNDHNFIDVRFEPKDLLKAREALFESEIIKAIGEVL